MNEIEFAGVKNLITEGGTATPETVGSRLSWGAERLAAWIKSSPAYQGYEIGDDEMTALRVLCAKGITTSFADFERSPKRKRHNEAD